MTKKMRLIMNKLLACRLFRNNQGETFLLQKGRSNSETIVSLYKLDGIDIDSVAEKTYHKGHSAKKPNITKEHKLNEQIVERQKKGKSIIGSLYDYDARDSIYFKEVKGKVKIGNTNFKYNPEPSISSIKKFCESFGAPGKRIFNNFIKGLKQSQD